MKLILISNPVHLNNEHQLLCSMFEAGLDRFHLRKPEFSREEMEQFIRSLPAEYHNRIVVHSHHDLAGKYALRGVHGKLPVVPREKGTSISTSFHSIAECMTTSYSYDYAFLSPVFDSISKENYRAGFIKDELTGFLKGRRSAGKMIALGGINERNILTAKEYGFDGVAVLGAVWMAASPLEGFLKLKRMSDVFNSIQLNEHV